MFMKKRLLWFFTKPFAYFMAHRVLKKENPEVIITFCPLYGSFLKKVDVPVVYDCHDDFSNFSGTEF